MRNISIIVVLISLCMPAAVFPQSSKYEGRTVKKIYFEGLRNADEDDLHYIMKTTPGYPLKSLEIREDIKKIFKKGNFESVVVEIEEFEGGVRLKFVCKERPIVKEISFKGLDEVSESDLTTAIPVKEGGTLRKDFLEKSITAIKKKYDGEGLFNAAVRYETKAMRGDENSVRVTFIIDEGEVVKLHKLTLLGVDKLKVKELLSVIDTAEKSLFKDGDFKRDTWEQDKAKLLAYYRQFGYLDAQILEESVEYEWVNPVKKEKRGIFVTLKLSEGERYYFDKYTIQVAASEAGKPVYSVKQIMEDFEQSRKGAVFNDTLFQQDRQMISFKYASKGYIFARVLPKRDVAEREVTIRGKVEKRKFVSVDFQIEEGAQAYIDMIIVKGNKKTKDKVIRREVVIREGELFDSRKLQLSREKVYNLGFFKQVNIDVRPGSREGYVNLIVDVEEQPTGTISLGGGYGTTSGFSIFADVAENNLLGNGQRVGVRFEYGPERTSVTLSFAERWLFNQPLGVNAAVFYNLYNVKSNQTVFPSVNSSLTDSTPEANYKRQALGYSLGLNYRFLDYHTAGVTWSHAFTKVVDPSGNASEEVFNSRRRGWQEKRSISLFLAHDSRDNYLNPTRGANIEFSANFTGGGVLGGSDHYIKLDPSIFVYFSPFHLPFLKNYPCVFEFRVSGSFIVKPGGANQVKRRQTYNQSVYGNVDLRYQWLSNLSNQNPFGNVDLRDPWLEPEDRLNLGGPETLRGWDYYDKHFPKSWQNVGLFHRILYGVEFRVPIHPQMLWFALFFDAGSLWSDTFWEQGLTRENQNIVAEDLVLNKKLYRLQEMGHVNILKYFKYSYGFGFRIQIPMMPLRFWFGRKLVYDGKFKNIGGFTFQFGIGDMRF